MPIGDIQGPEKVPSFGYRLESAILRGKDGVGRAYQAIRSAFSPLIQAIEKVAIRILYFKEEYDLAAARKLHNLEVDRILGKARPSADAVDKLVPFKSSQTLGPGNIPEIQQIRQAHEKLNADARFTSIVEQQENSPAVLDKRQILESIERDNDVSILLKASPSIQKDLKFILNLALDHPKIIELFNPQAEKHIPIKRFEVFKAIHTLLIKKREQFLKNPSALMEAVNRLSENSTFDQKAIFGALLSNKGFITDFIKAIKDEGDAAKYWAFLKVHLSPQLQKDESISQALADLKKSAGTVEDRFFF